MFIRIIHYVSYSLCLLYWRFIHCLLFPLKLYFSLLYHLSIIPHEWLYPLNVYPIWLYQLKTDYLLLYRSLHIPERWAMWLANENASWIEAVRKVTSLRKQTNSDPLLSIDKNTSLITLVAGSIFFSTLYLDLWQIGLIIVSNTCIWRRQ